MVRLAQTLGRTNPCRVPSFLLPRLKAMNIRCVAFISIFTLLSGQVHSQSLIVCRSSTKGSTVVNPIWPAPYLAQNGALCFDVTGWPEYSGHNCVTDGGHAAWTGTIIVSMDGESQGRDLTFFRVNDAIVKKERLEYAIEWSRGSAWKPMQNIKINRLSGSAVSYFVTMHGGDSYRCHLERKKI